jgi:uncharacterized ferritin-like protein (DUF455 family)
MLEARKGQDVWNKGKSLSAEHKQALSNVRKGRPYSAQRRQKMITKIREIRGSDWTPNVIQSIRDSIQYKGWRNTILKRDNFHCVICNYQSHKRVNNRSDIQVDHIKAFSVLVQEYKIITIEMAFNCEALWDIDNGRTLCIDCHRQTPTYGRGVLYNTGL